MFDGCSGLTSIDLSNFDTSKVTDMSYMFEYCTVLVEVIMIGDISNVTNTNSMFYGVNTTGILYYDLAYKEYYTKLPIPSPWRLKPYSYIEATYTPSTTYNSTTLMGSDFDISKVRTMYIDGVKLSSVDATYKFSDTNSHVVKIMLNDDITDLNGMFTSCKELTAIRLSSLDTSNLTIIKNMFRGCSGLSSLDVSNFDTSNVTDMSGMFYGCSGLTSLDVSNFDTSNVTDMSEMFYGCSGLTSLDVSNFDTSNVTTMWSMFSGCSGLTSIDVSNFDTGNTKYMNWMFGECSQLTTLDLSNFNMSNLIYARSMFSKSTSLVSVKFGKTSNRLNQTSIESVFEGITTTGTLYYPSGYSGSYNIFINNMPSTWTAEAY
jgi:surface protein